MDDIIHGVAIFCISGSQTFVHQNYLKGLLKHIVLVPLFKDSDSMGLRPDNLYL